MPRSVLPARTALRVCKQLQTAAFLFDQLKATRTVGDALPPFAFHLARRFVEPYAQ